MWLYMWLYKQMIWSKFQINFASVNFSNVIDYKPELFLRMILQNVNTQLATIHSWLKFLIQHAITHHQERMQQSRVLYVHWVSISTFLFSLFDS